MLDTFEEHRCSVELQKYDFFLQNTVHHRAMVVTELYMLH